jgi:hypothetical protein
MYQYLPVESEVVEHVYHVHSLVYPDLRCDFGCEGLHLSPTTPTYYSSHGPGHSVEKKELGFQIQPVDTGDQALSSLLRLV